jgi:Protein of unknown function (DUF2934)
LKNREQRIREIAYRLWEESGRPSEQQDKHWQAARQILIAQDPDACSEAPTVSLLSISERSAGASLHTLDEIVAGAQKAVALSLQQAFDAGRAQMASELKRGMVAIFQGLVSSDAAPRGEPLPRPLTKASPQVASGTSDEIQTEKSAHGV